MELKIFVPNIAGTQKSLNNLVIGDMVIIHTDKRRKAYVRGTMTNQDGLFGIVLSDQKVEKSN